MAWTNPATRSSGYKVTAANWNELVNNALFLAEIGYVEYTSNVAVTATTVATAVQVVSLGAITYTADPISLEFYCSRFTCGGGGANLILRDGTTVLGTIASFSTTSFATPVFAVREFTPTAASHTYNVALWNSAAGTATAAAGTGGAAGDTTTQLPGFIRARYVPR
jgi:hypothetical protein